MKEITHDQYDTLDKEVFEKTRDFHNLKEFSKSSLRKSSNTEEDFQEFVETQDFNGTKNFSNGNRNELIKTGKKYLETFKLHPLMMKGKENKETFYDCYPKIEELVEGKNYNKRRVGELSYDNPFLTPKEFYEKNIVPLQNSGMDFNNIRGNENRNSFNNTAFYEHFKKDSMKRNQVEHFPYLNRCME